jgi:hypothetical protein
MLILAKEVCTQVATAPVDPVMGTPAFELQDSIQLLWSGDHH